MQSLNPKVSVCIPVYEMHGKGIIFLHELLSSIKRQSYDNIEVVISDHSKSDGIQKYVYTILADFAKVNIELIYSRLKEKHGNSSANMNNALNLSTGKIIKPMFQDDFFCNNDCIYEIVQGLLDNPKSTWGSVGFIHTDENNDYYYGNQIPSYNKQILSGNNTLGCPSTCFFKKNDILFDEKLIWLMDCEFYHNLKRKFGDPLIITKTRIAVRVWSQSVSYEINNITKESEERYVLEKHSETKYSLDIK